MLYFHMTYNAVKIINSNCILPKRIWYLKYLLTFLSYPTKTLTTSLLQLKNNGINFYISWLFLSFDFAHA